MSGGFKRSGVFGIVGVFVVAAVVAVIALTMGEGDPDPKAAYALIFGVIAIFCVGLFALQRADLNRVAREDSQAHTRAGAEAGHRIEDPTRLGEAELWAALAVAPIDADAIAARDEVWGAGRRSLRLGALVTALVFLTVPTIYLTGSFIPLFVGGPLILAAALWGAFTAIGPGGELEQGYERADRMMAPLGLAVTERPRGGFEMRIASPGFDYRLRGDTVLGGARHGRQVVVRIGGHEEAGTSSVAVAEPCAEFLAESKRLRVQSGPEGILVVRRKGKPQDWLCDLWLAEHLAAG